MHHSVSTDSLKQCNLFWFSDLQRGCFLIKAELQEGKGSAGPDYSLWKRHSSVGHFSRMMSSHKEFLSNAWKMSCLPVTAYCSCPCQWKGRWRLHQWSLRAGAAIPTGACWAKRSGWHLGEVSVRRKKGGAKLGPCRAACCLPKVTVTESV